MSVHRISTTSHTGTGTGTGTGTSPIHSSSQTSHASHPSQQLQSSDSDHQEDARLLIRTRPTMADLEAYSKETKPSPTSSHSSSSNDVVDHQHPLHHLITHDNTNASIMVCELFTAQCACLWFGLVLIAFAIYVILQYQCIIPFRPYAAYAVTELFLLPISICLLIGAITHFHKLRYAIATTNIYALPLLLWLILFLMLPLFGWLLFYGVLTPPKRSIAAATPILIEATGHNSAVLPDPRNGSCPNLDTSTTITMAYVMNGIHSFFLLLFFIGCCHPRWNSSESIYASYSYHGEDTVEAKRRVYHEQSKTPRKPPTEPSWFAPYKKSNTSPSSPPPPISKSLARTTSMGDFIGTHPRSSSQIDPAQLAAILSQQAEDERKALERTQRREKRKIKKLKRQSSQDSTTSQTSRGSRQSLTSQTSLENVISVLSQESPGNDPGGVEVHVQTPAVLITVDEGGDDPGTHHSPRYSLAPPMPERSVSVSSTTSSIGEFTVPLAISIIPPTPEQSPEVEHSSRPASPMPEL